jgi:hypothetical protein
MHYDLPAPLVSPSNNSASAISLALSVFYCFCHLMTRGNIVCQKYICKAVVLLNSGCSQLKNLKDSYM